MRVLALIHDAYGGIGGTARFNRDLIRALASHPACREVVALPRYRPLPAEKPPAKVVFDTAALGGKPAYGLRCLRWLAAGGGFDLIVCGHVNLAPFAWLWRLRRRAPIGLVMHGTDIWTPTPNELANRLAPRADFHVAVSRLTAERFAAWAEVDPARVFVLPNCVDLDRFRPGPKDPALLARYGLEGCRVILTLGRLDQRERAKGVDQVLEVLPALVAGDASLRYLVAGEGDDRKRLAAKARALGLAAQVVFTGFVAEDEKADHYRLADAYVMPSRGEGFGIVFLEALACGVPVVGSRLDGGREALMDGRLGALVDPDDPAELTAAIVAALGKPKGVVPDALETFSPARFDRRVHDIVDRVVGADG